MQIGDVVFHQKYGVGKIKKFNGLAYLVYYYKENFSLHNGFIGPNYHYWWDYAEDLKLISSVPVRILIERRQHG